MVEGLHNDLARRDNLTDKKSTKFGALSKEAIE